MDWNAFLSGLGGAAVILAAFAFPIKKWVSRKIDLGFDRRRELDVAEVREQFRQDAALYDEQVAQLQAVLELLGKIRDVAVGAHEAAENGWSLDMNNSFRAIGTMYGPLRDMVHMGRTVLPLEAFVVVHELQGPVQTLRGMAVPDEEVLPEYASYRESFRNEILAVAEQIDLGFQYLTSVARAIRRVDPVGVSYERVKVGQRAVLPELGGQEVHNLPALEHVLSQMRSKSLKRPS